MRIISWNVNGLRACLGKGFGEFFTAIQADIFCVQETKMQPDQARVHFEGYESYYNSAEKKGYSGTAIFTRIPPLQVARGMGIGEHDREGRLITMEFRDFFLVNVYTPNSQRGLTRLEYRLRWEDDFREYAKNLDLRKPVILCGDINVAHAEIDLKNPGPNRRNAGFTDEERGKMTEFLGAGFIDAFRFFYPDKKDAYTWWSYMANARSRNIGWRIDYFLFSGRIRDAVTDSAIYPEILGSDHCPVGLELRL